MTCRSCIHIYLSVPHDVRQMEQFVPSWCDVTSMELLQFRWSLKLNKEWKRFWAQLVLLLCVMDHCPSPAVASDTQEPLCSSEGRGFHLVLRDTEDKLSSLVQAWHSNNAIAVTNPQHVDKNLHSNLALRVTIQQARHLAIDNVIITFLIIHTGNTHKITGEYTQSLL